MKSSTKDKAEGTCHEVKAKFKQVAGNLNNNPKLEAGATVENRAVESAGKDRTGQEVAGEVVRSANHAFMLICAPDCAGMLHLCGNSARHDAFGVKEFISATNCGNRLSVRGAPDNDNKENSEQDLNLENGCEKYPGLMYYRDELQLLP